MDNVVKVFVNVIKVILDHVVMLHVSFFLLLKKTKKNSIINSNFILADLCANVNCNYGACSEGRCSCYEGYTGYYCDTPSMILFFKEISVFYSFKIISYNTSTTRNCCSYNNTSTFSTTTCWCYWSKERSIN